MNKTVKTLLSEYHLLVLSDRLVSLQGKASEEVSQINNEINTIKQNGISLSLKGSVKNYLDIEVNDTPKLIKSNNTTIGIALKIGERSISGGKVPMYFTYIHLNGKDIFKVTDMPTEHVTEVGNFPKEIKNLTFQLGISPSLTHLIYLENYRLVFEKYSSTIRKMPENYLVAVVSENYNLNFDTQDVCVKEMNMEIVNDMWKRGLIPTKESTLI